MALSSAGGCSGPGLENPVKDTAALERAGTEASSSAGLCRRGFEHFNRGEFGLAEQDFREAVERTPDNGPAWIGLAASNDRLRRFDLADRAYTRAIEIAGETPVILNNQGYSQLLRGNLKSARAKFVEAARKDPQNPIVSNNLRMLDRGAYLITHDN